MGYIMATDGPQAGHKRSTVDQRISLIISVNIGKQDLPIFTDIGNHALPIFTNIIPKHAAAIFSVVAVTTKVSD